MADAAETTIGVEDVEEVSTMPIPSQLISTSRQDRAHHRLTWRSKDMHRLRLLVGLHLAGTTRMADTTLATRIIIIRIIRDIKVKATRAMAVTRISTMAATMVEVETIILIAMVADIEVVVGVEAAEVVVEEIMAEAAETTITIGIDAACIKKKAVGVRVAARPSSSMISSWLC